MLKVKEGIPLQELEKYGFKKQPRPYTGYYLCVAVGARVIFVNPDEGGKIIHHEKWEDNDTRIHKRPNCKYRANYLVDDILYDLITAGIVVKE